MANGLRKKLCNLLSFHPTYYFDDGTVIRRSSRESLTYEGLEKSVEVECYFGTPKGFVYYLPTNIANDERVELARKLEIYFQRKRYVARLGS